MQEANIKNLRKEFINPFVRMLPLAGSAQRGVYRVGDPHPAGLEGYQPRWQVLNAVLGAQQTIQTTVDLPTDFHLLALLASATSEVAFGELALPVKSQGPPVKFQEPGQLRVPFQGDHPAGGGCQKGGEGPQTGADLHHGFLAGKVQGRDNAPGLVGVKQKVLPQGLLRPQAQTLQEGFGRDEGH